MRAASLGLLLLIPALAGCIGPTGDGNDENIEPEALMAELDLPDGAEVVETAEGVVVTLTEAELPFEHELTIPAGTTMVRLTTEVAGDASVGSYIFNTDTQRRRCNAPAVENGWGPVRGSSTCSAITAVDELPASWTLEGWSFSASVADRITIELMTVPVDGLPAMLDLDLLSKPVHDLMPTEDAWIDAHDGAVLYGQLTRPDVEGPVPTIISSSPYNGGSHGAGEPSMWGYFVQDWAKRGFAVLSADVRGTGRSTGCMEVWGYNEQQDQATLVEWVAAQDWSDGNVGFYGQSYVGTTPTAAAVLAPDALKAIIAVAPVISAYDDWHFGGVPNGESIGSPASYQAFTGVAANVEPTRPEGLAANAVSGLCDPALIARANDPRAIYDAFYEERDFSLGAGDVKAAVLYTEGFEDSNVKSAMIPPWFNAIDAPKLGLFGHWVHQHPTRMDQEVLFLAWMDQYVKGVDLGADELPPVDVVTNVGTHRATDHWPPLEGDEGFSLGAFGADLDGGRLVDGDGIGSASIAVGASSLLLQTAGLASSVSVERAVDDELHVAGVATLNLTGSLEGVENAHVAAWMEDVAPDGRVTEVTFGMVNLAHHEGRDTYSPLAPGQSVTVALPFLPTEYAFEPGHTLRITLRASQPLDWFLTPPTAPGTFVIDGAGTALVLPLVDPASDEPAPITAQW